MTPLTEARVRYIRAGLSRGRKIHHIAVSMGLSYSYVSRLKREHLKGFEFDPSDPQYLEYLNDRWLNVHKIGDIAKRAVEETA